MIESIAEKFIIDGTRDGPYDATAHPLTLDVSYNHFEFFKYMVETYKLTKKELDIIDCSGYSILYTLCDNTGDIDEFVEYLINKQVDLNRKTRNGKIFLWAYFKHRNCLKFDYNGSRYVINKIETDR
jgi:hypothetical protein